MKIILKIIFVNGFVNGCCFILDYGTISQVKAGGGLGRQRNRRERPPCTSAGITCFWIGFTKARQNLMDINERVLFENCGVEEGMFPCLGICCSENDTLFGVSYAKVCPYCRISTSLPYGQDLKTATIIECDRLGYGKRIKK